jgi:hypothetical protein
MEGIPTPNEKITSPRELPTGTSEGESEILNFLTRAQIEFVESRKVDNLNSIKEKIVAVRSEDIFYFLTCVEKGFIPVASESPLTGKITHGEKLPYFFTHGNPEHPLIKSRKISWGPETRTLSDVTNFNVNNYGKIGVTQGIYRNIIPDTKGIDPILRSYRNNLPSFAEKSYSLELSKDDVSLDQEGIGIAREIFYDNLLTDLGIWKPTIGARADNKLALSALLENLNPGISPEKIIVRLKDIAERTGIIVGFNQKLLDTAERIESEDSDIVHGANEVVFGIRSGKIDIQLIAGFETMGTYEDSVLEYIGVE